MFRDPDALVSQRFRVRGDITGVIERCSSIRALSNPDQLKQRKSSHETPQQQKPDKVSGSCVYGGEGEIRTHGTLIRYARFRGGWLQPLDHLSVCAATP